MRTLVFEPLGMTCTGFQNDEALRRRVVQRWRIR
jgi:CubicO group peptidase (beta-lactamase class C family)